MKKNKSCYEEYFGNLRQKILDKNILYNYIYNINNNNYNIMSNKQMERIKECFTYMQHLSDIEFSKFKLYRSNSCGNRFCPVCSRNKAIKDSIALQMICNYLVSSFDYEYCFLTLTCPNCAVTELEETINRFNKAFEKMMRRTKFKFIQGYVRKLEVTYNQDENSKSYNSFHPHFHVILAVNPSYFNNTKIYLTRDEWLKAWQECMNDFSITQVDIRKISLEASQGINKSILEIAKYVSKSNDYLSSESVFYEFYKALKGKRLYSFSGCFKMAVVDFKKGLLDEYKPQDDTIWYWLITHKIKSERFFEDIQKINNLKAGEKQAIQDYLIKYELEEIKKEFE